MAKLTREELENVTGESIDALIRDKRIRLSTSPFGSQPGKVTVSIGRAVPWKKRGHLVKKLHLIR